MSNLGNQIQIYQELDVHRPVSFPELPYLNSKAKPPPLLLENLVNDENLLFFNFEVLLVSLLLLALPIIIYLAYRYGKRMGRKEHVSDAHAFFGQHTIKKQSSPLFSNDESYHPFNSMNSKTSSTASSPALNPSIAQQNPVSIKEKHILTSLSFPKAKRESSVQTEEENIEDLQLNDGTIVKFSPQEQMILNQNIINTNNEGQNIQKLKTLASRFTEGKEKNESPCKEVFKRRSFFIPNNSDHIEVSPNGSERKMKSTEIKGKFAPLNHKGEKFQLSNDDKEKLNFFEKDGEGFLPPRSLLSLDLKRHFSMGEERRPILQGMAPRGNSENLKNKTSNFLLESKEDSKRDDKTTSEKRIESLVEKYELPDETGKFHKIFKDVEWIGEGSFGEVYKVQLSITKCIYRF